MKYSKEWGNGKIRSRINMLDQIRRRPNYGGSGAVLCGKYSNGFCLKLVRLLKPAPGTENGKRSDELFYLPKGEYNRLFWSEAQSVSSYTTVARNIPGCVKCPIPAQYWIHEEEPCFRDFKQGKLSEERPRSLADFGSLFDINIKQWHKTGIEPGEYWYVPAKLLEDIREQKIECDLIMTYPILQGDSSLKSVMRTEAQDIRQMIYQILSAILELYRSGLAHGDVKPENIMWRRRLPSETAYRKHYFLSDVGSVHSTDMASNTGTKAFFYTEVYNQWQKAGDCKKLIGKDGFRPEKDFPEEDLKKLLCRTLMDGYALAVTIYVLATGKQPSFSLPPSVPVREKWGDEKICRAFGTLADVVNLTIGKMQQVVDDLQEEFSGLREIPFSIKTWGKESEFNFVTKWTEQKNEDIKVEYGYLADQLNFSGKFNPMLRVCQKQETGLPPWATVNPVIESYSNGNRFVHALCYAPDDAESGSRAVSFDNYQPYSLEYLLDNGKLTDEIIEELLSFGSRIDEALTDSRRTVFVYPQDIVKLDGKWVILPFFLSSGVWCGHEKINMEEYFKMLCGRANALTPQNWLDILQFDHEVGILFELLPDDMVDKIAEYILLPETIENNSEIIIRNLVNTTKFSKYKAQIEECFCNQRPRFSSRQWKTAYSGSCNKYNKS